MTSSLVGSEMCIRDSLLPNHCPHDRSSKSLSQTVWDSRANCPGALYVPCLLYTSDAADDM
eukprot:3507664-Prorocentrum_lima.AAC.1